jgi:hypothetical protein
MLRNIVLALGGALFVTGILGLLSGHYATSAVMLVWGGVMAFGIVYERYLYKTIVEKAPDGKHWIQTPERFVDPKSGRKVVVWYNTLTGERSYVVIPED